MKPARRSHRHRRPLGWFVVVFLLGQGAACFRSPDVAKLKCTTDPTSCPNGYSCVIPLGESFGSCLPVTPGTDGAASDASLSLDAPGALDGARVEVGLTPVDGAIDRSGGGVDQRADSAQPDSVGGPDAPHLDGFGPDLPISSDGPMSDLPDGPGPDVPIAGPEAGGGCTVATDCPGPCQTCSPSTHTCVSVTSQADPSGKCTGTCDATGACKATQGQTCQTSASCASGLSCSPDGHCCNRACTGTCESCETGTCQPVTGAPRTGHGSCAGTSTECAGSCSGAADGQCTWPTNACGQASCTTLANAQAQPTGTTFVPQGSCSSGACSPGTATSCPGSLVCASATVCKTACATDADCLVGNACMAGVCGGKKGIGTACSGSNQCQSGSCVDGFCCESACTGTCVACSRAKTGVADGYCRDVTTGTDPDAECTLDTSNTCGFDGTCGTGGACRFQPLGISCGTVSCSGGMRTPLGSCDGAGRCQAGTPAPCPSNLPCASSTACATSCTANSTTGCPLGYKCASSGASCILATMPCGGMNCPIANGGGLCCIEGEIGGPFTQTCVAPGGTCGGSAMACHSKADCPSGQICCASRTGCYTGSTKCVPPTDSLCQDGSMSSADQFCDPGLTPSECPSTEPYCQGDAFGICGPNDIYVCRP